MKVNTLIWKAFGLTVLAFWAIEWVWGLLRAFVGPAIIDPTHFLLGDSYSNLSLMTLDFFLLFSPLIALLTFLVPLIQVKRSPGDGMLLQISVHQAGAINLIVIGLCGAASLILFAVILAARLS